MPHTSAASIRLQKVKSSCASLRWRRRRTTPVGLLGRSVSLGSEPRLGATRIHNEERAVTARTATVEQGARPDVRPPIDKEVTLRGLELANSGPCRRGAMTRNFRRLAVALALVLATLASPFARSTASASVNPVECVSAKHQLIDVFVQSALIGQVTIGTWSLQIAWCWNGTSVLGAPSYILAFETVGGAGAAYAVTHTITHEGHSVLTPSTAVYYSKDVVSVGIDAAPGNRLTISFDVDWSVGAGASTFVEHDEPRPTNAPPPVPVLPPPANSAPRATISSQRLSGELAGVVLDGRGSSDADGKIVKWEWRTDGFASLFGPTATFHFPDGAPRSVTLLVTDNRGETAQKTVALSFPMSVWVVNGCDQLMYKTSWMGAWVNDTPCGGARQVEVSADGQTIMNILPNGSLIGKRGVTGRWDTHTPPGGAKSVSVSW